jgi:hypothetical protein
MAAALRRNEIEKGTANSQKRRKPRWYYNKVCGGQPYATLLCGGMRM